MPTSSLILALMACACQITVGTMARISEEQAPTIEGFRSQMTNHLVFLKLLLKIEATQQHFGQAHLHRLIEAFSSQPELLLTLFSQPVVGLMLSCAVPVVLVQLGDTVVVLSFCACIAH